ncbi:hypothetical protein ABW20_dc0109826 [Dactylellina cionopaga]|nr:hypothetical protein ABW20_dc0109826 [Dactylellina cionopaga]
MEVQEVIRLALTSDWSKGLRSAPELIHILGICATMTSNKEIMALQLHDVRLVESIASLKSWTVVISASTLGYLQNIGAGAGNR